MCIQPTNDEGDRSGREPPNTDDESAGGPRTGVFEGRLIDARKSPGKMEKWVAFANAARGGDRSWGQEQERWQHDPTRKTWQTSSRVDLREPWWSVLDQGSTAGCVGWAVADALSYYLVRAGMLPAEGGDRPSARYLWQAAKEMDPYVDFPTTFVAGEGTSIEAALHVARIWGVALESEIPSTSTALYAGRARDLFAKAAGRRIVGHIGLGEDLNHWRRWLASRKRPIVARIWADEAFLAAKGETIETYDPRKVQFAHAVQIVGYRIPHDGQTDPTPAFLVKNTWGTGWGQGGYAWIRERHARKQFLEGYGVVIETGLPRYPDKELAVRKDP
jgi:hypothetical protein